MPQLFQMFTERKEQLQKQETIDNALTHLNGQCPAIVSDYLLLQRKITRNQQYKIINTSLFSLYDEMQTQLNVNKSIAFRFLGGPSHPAMTCLALAKINKDKSLLAIYNE
jgi:hypothetical protein